MVSEDSGLEQLQEYVPDSQCFTEMLTSQRGGSHLNKPHKYCPTARVLYFKEKEVCANKSGFYILLEKCALEIKSIMTELKTYWASYTRLCTAHKDDWLIYKL